MAVHRLHKQRVAAGLLTVRSRFTQLHELSDEVTFSNWTRIRDGEKKVDI